MTAQTVDLLARERSLRADGLRLIAGVDESGRAAWAGPLVAAAVILPPDFDLEGIADGKTLSRKRRELAYERILASASAWRVSIHEPATINERGIHWCNLDLLTRAVQELEPQPDYVLIDGLNIPSELGFDSEAIVGGDGNSASIASASIVAKVTRDRLMDELHARYPQYGFNRNRGYWSSGHVNALNRYGLCLAHRLNKATRRWLGSQPSIDP